MVARKILAVSSSEENPYNIPFYRWQIFQKKISKSKADVTFKDAVGMFKDGIKTLKEHICTKREQINANQEIKASFSENDLILHEDFTESYKNDQKYAIQNAYFKNQSFSIFTECRYTKSPNNSNVRNFWKFWLQQSRVYDCLQKVIHKIERMHEKRRKECFWLEWWNWVSI